MSSLIRLLSENVAAISADVHSRADYEDLYSIAFADTDGFVGIWNLCAEVGAVFTDVEIEERQIAGETYEWIDAITAIVDRIYDCCIGGDGPEATDWKAEVRAAIASSVYPETQRATRIVDVSVTLLHLNARLYHTD